MMEGWIGRGWMVSVACGRLQATFSHVQHFHYRDMFEIMRGSPDPQDGAGRVGGVIGGNNVINRG